MTGTPNYLDMGTTVDVMNGDEVDHDYGNAPWHIGLADPSAASCGLWGHLEITDVKIFDRLLDTTEILALSGR